MRGSSLTGRVCPSECSGVCHVEVLVRAGHRGGLAIQAEPIRLKAFIRGGHYGIPVLFGKNGVAFLWKMTVPLACAPLVSVSYCGFFLLSIAVRDRKKDFMSKNDEMNKAVVENE